MRSVGYVTAGLLVSFGVLAVLALLGAMLWPTIHREWKARQEKRL